MTKNKFFPYALNSSPLHPQLPPDQGTCYYSSPTEGGGSRRIWGYHVVFKGGGRSGISRRWQSVKEGDRRNLTASKRGGGCQNTTEPRGGGEQANLN